MSAAFTNPSGATWQTLLDEITLAYSERRQVLGQSAYTPAASRNVQSAAYWRVFQNWLEANCAAFIDWKNGPLDNDRRNFVYFTLSTWRAAAGINAAGFKRANNGAISYGLMQQNDEIRSWVFSEIQNGFSVLRETVRGGGGVAEERIGTSGRMWEHEDDTSCEAVFPYHDISWNASEWIEAVTYADRWYWATASKRAILEWDTEAFSSVRHRGYPKITQLPTNIYCAADVYATGYPARRPLYDIDGLGIESGKLFFVESLPESNQEERIGSLFGNYDTSPLSIMGYSCPYPDVSEVAEVYFLNSTWHLKWNFTNCNELT